MASENVNIIIIGPISAGKSTFLNAITCDTYSDMKRKRTTMSPQIYQITNDKTAIMPAETIIDLTKKDNERILKLRESGQFNGNELKELTFNIAAVPEFVEMPDIDAYYNITDMPGLNDQASTIYNDYIIRNSAKFDIYIVVFDINSSLNTSDEINIMKLIIEQVKKNGYGFIHVLMNKADEFVFNKSGFDIHDTELKELYTQAENTVKNLCENAGITTWDKYIENINQNKTNANTVTGFYNITPITAAQSYVYRTIKYNPSAEIEEKCLDTIITNEVGKKELNRLKDINNKKKFLTGLFQAESARHTDGLISCGYTLFRNNFNHIIYNEYPQIISHHIIKNVADITAKPVTNIENELKQLYSLFERYEHLCFIIANANGSTDSSDPTRERKNKLTIAPIVNIAKLKIINAIERVNKYANDGIKTYIGSNIETCNKNIGFFRTFIKGMNKFINIITKKLGGVNEEFKYIESKIPETVTETLEKIKSQRLILLNAELSKGYNEQIFKELVTTGTIDIAAFKNSIRTIEMDLEGSNILGVLESVANIVDSDIKYLEIIMMNYWNNYSYSNTFIDQTLSFSHKNIESSGFKNVSSFYKYMYLITMKATSLNKLYNTDIYDNFEKLCTIHNKMSNILFKILSE